MRRGGRKTTPRVKDGRVQPKNHRDGWIGRGGPFEIVEEAPARAFRHVLTADDVRRFVALIPGWAEVSVGLRAIVLAPGEPGVEGSYRRGVVELHAWPDPPASTFGARFFAEHRALFERIGVPWRADPAFLGSIRSTDYITDTRAIRESIWDWFDDLDLVEEASDYQWVVVDRKLKLDGPICGEVVCVDDEYHVYQQRYTVAFDRRTARAYQLLHVLLHQLGHHVGAMMLPPRRSTDGREGHAEGWAARCAEQVWDRYWAEFG